MRRPARSITLPLALAITACSGGDGSTASGPTGPGVPFVDASEIARVSIVDEGNSQINLRRGVTHEVRVRGLDAAGRPIPGAERHLRLEPEEIVVASTLFGEDDDPADGERVFEVTSRFPGRTDLVATVEGGSPLVTDVLTLHVLPQGPDPALMPGRYRFEGEVAPVRNLCPDADPELVIEDIDVRLEGGILRARLGFGEVSGSYDPLEVVWIGTGSGALDDGTPIEIQLDGVWLRRDSRIMLEDGLAFRRLDDAGQAICTVAYFGELSGLIR